MKLKKLLLLALLGICVPMTSCNDEKEPVNDPASEEVPHHPTSNFDMCPLLAHIDKPKLGIKEITVEEYRDGELVKDSKKVYSYDKEQRLIRVTANDWYNTYEYDVKGRLVKYVSMATSGTWGDMYAFFYDDYGFLTKFSGEDLIEETSNGDEAVYIYKQDTVFYNHKNGSTVWYVYSDDMYMITEGDERYILDYEWEKGNCLNRSERNGNGWQYAYDDKMNILRWLDAVPMCFTFCEKSENNMIQEQRYEGSNNVIKYTYDAKGMVTSMSRKRDDATWKEVFTYIYY